MSAATPIRMYPVLNDKPIKIPGGYYLKARCIQDSAIAHAPPHVREIWDYLIKESNYGDRKTHGSIIRRGQLFTDYHEIMDALSWREGFVKKSYKKHHVDYAMRWLRQEAMITTEKTTRGLIITLCKYDTYQNPENYENASDYDTQRGTARSTNGSEMANDTASDTAKSVTYSESTRNKDGNASDYDTITTRLRQPTTTILKESKEGKEGKKEDTPPAEPVLNVPFETFWDKYAKKTGKIEKLKKQWAKFSDAERDEIMAYIPAYVQSTPNKKYRKNPETFFNNTGWKDEIIKPTTNATHSTTPASNKQSVASSFLKRGQELFGATGTEDA